MWNKLKCGFTFHEYTSLAEQMGFESLRLARYREEKRREGLTDMEIFFRACELKCKHCGHTRPSAYLGY